MDGPVENRARTYKRKPRVKKKLLISRQEGRTQCLISTKNCLKIKIYIDTFFLLEH
jgi:hypothetical protein